MYGEPNRDLSQPFVFVVVVVVVVVVVGRFTYPAQWGLPRAPLAWRSRPGSRDRPCLSYLVCTSSNRETQRCSTVDTTGEGGGSDLIYRVQPRRHSLTLGSWSRAVHKSVAGTTALGKKRNASVVLVSILRPGPGKRGGQTAGGGGGGPCLMMGTRGFENMAGHGMHDARTRRPQVVLYRKGSPRLTEYRGCCCGRQTKKKEDGNRVPGTGDKTVSERELVY